MTDEQIFTQVIEVRPEKRQAFLDAKCQDREQRSRVEDLVAAHEQPDDLLDTEAMVSAGDTAVDGAMQKTLGDFHIIRELGRGGMGVVYEAHQKSLNRKVALSRQSLQKYSARKTYERQTRLRGSFLCVKPRLRSISDELTSTRLQDFVFDSKRSENS